MYVNLLVNTDDTDVLVILSDLMYSRGNSKIKQSVLSVLTVVYHYTKAPPPPAA